MSLSDGLGKSSSRLDSAKPAVSVFRTGSLSNSFDPKAGWGCAGCPGDGCPVASSPGSPKSWAAMRRTSALPIGPNPGIESGALKSQEFSDRPTKSRIAGSALQARRRAARLSAAGTPRCRKALMSELAVIELERRQSGDVELRIDRRGRRRFPVGGRHRCLFLRRRLLRRRIEFPLRPAREKILRIAHLRSSSRPGARRAMASVLARSRLRLKNCRST